MKTKISINDAIGKAVDRRDAKLAGALCDALRFQLGMNYRQILNRVQRVRPSVSAADWDELLQEADECEAQS